MTERELLRAIGEIDEKYIEEAAPSAAVKVIDAGKKRRRRRHMFSAAAAAAAAVFLIGIFPKMQRTMLTADKGAVMTERSAAPAAAAGDEEAAEVFMDETVQEMKAGEAPAETFAAADAEQEMYAAETAAEMYAATEAPDTYAAAPAMPAPEALTTAAAQIINNLEAAASEEKTAGSERKALGADMAQEEMAAAQDQGGMAAGWGNPFIPCESMEEAAGLAGFAMEVPAETALTEQYPVRDITAIKDTMIQVICYDAAGNEGFRMRKAAGEEDISGVYGTYEEKTLESGDRTLQLRLKEGLVRTICWTEDGFSYAVTTDEAELDEEAAAKLADGIR
ncbi:MAG: hypothetical protein IKH70_02825 [Stomatobaculum sp.]|nr:hypothetical protein [Stomatobaculum sp.]